MEIFHDRHQSVVAAAVRRIDSSAAFADDVYQLVVERLFVTAGDEPPRILSYGGRGPLRGWVAVAAQRIALSLRGADNFRASRDLQVVAVAYLAAAGTDVAACDERERSIYVAAVRKRSRSWVIASGCCCV